MRGFDYSPFYRATVGFDRVFDLLDNVAGQTAGNGYPPYNIEKAGDNAYRIVMAVAGFAESRAEPDPEGERAPGHRPDRADRGRRQAVSSIAASPAATSSAASSSPTM